MTAAYKWTNNTNLFGLFNTAVGEIMTHAGGDEYDYHLPTKVVRVTISRYAIQTFLDRGFILEVDASEVPAIPEETAEPLPEVLEEAPVMKAAPPSPEIEEPEGDGLDEAMAEVEPEAEETPESEDQPEVNENEPKAEAPAKKRGRPAKH